MFLINNIENMTRSHVHKLFSKGYIFKNNETINKNYRLKFGDYIVIKNYIPEKVDIVEENIKLDI